MHDRDKDVAFAGSCSSQARRIRLLLVASIACLLGWASSAYAATGAPTNAVLPVISGTARDGSNLNATQGKWLGLSPITYGYRWQRCDSAGSSCTTIPSAEKHSYLLQHADVGHTLRVIVTATNVAGSGKATSNQSAVIAPLAPAKAKAPVISGTPEDGQVVTASTGTWKGTPPFSFTYQWKICFKLTCSVIPGATEPTYRATTSQIGLTLRVLVSATNVVGTATNSSTLSPKIVPGPPVNMALPTISGLPVDGQTLTASNGTWVGTSPFSYAYQWRSCSILTGECADIPGATSSSYTAGPLDVANKLSVVVTASGSHGVASATSAPTSVVSALLPSNISLPSITGSLIDGQLLSAVTGGWSGTAPINYSYQWQQCDNKGEACKALGGATSGTLALVSGLVGSTVRVVVTATNAGGATQATSPATSLIGALLPNNLSLPSIAGSLIDGQLLSAAVGSWSGSSPISYSYQWEQCNSVGEACKELGGATGATLGLLSSLVGSTVRVVVTATNSGGSTQATSIPTGLIGALIPANTSLPSITGSLIDGQLLSAVTGSWTGTGPVNYGYQWQQCNAAGEGCKDISGAAAGTLGLVSTLVGSTVRVIVTATNGGGTTQATSPATGLVGALIPGNVSLPSIVGSLIDGQTLTAATGSWSGTGPIGYSYQWEQCNNTGKECKELSGATGATLGLISTLVGSTVRVVVTASNGGGSTQATSPATGLVGALIPGNVSLPSITGSLIDGQLLSAATGAWTGTGPIGYAYQWRQCNAAGEACKDISGATTGTLALLSSLVGSTVRVVVTATNGGGSTQVASAPTSLVGALLPGNTTLPSVVGSLIDGQTLTAAIGSWTGTGPINYSYQWEQCNAAGEECKELIGATGSTLGLLSSLVGSTVRVVVSATNAGGTTQAASAPTGLIGALLPGNVSLPSIAGGLIDGQTLSAAAGSWTGTGPINYSYQWQQCNSKGETCKELAGATGATLGLISSLVGSTLRVIVTATNGAGSTQATSAPTALIGALTPGNVSLPSIGGALIDGQLLSVATGTWTGTGPINYSYQWEQCNAAGKECKELSGATAGTLGLISSLVGSTVRVVVTATNAGGTTHATSPATGLVGALIPGNTALPSIAGSLIDGQFLSAATGAWTGTGPIGYAYQWQQCNAAGEACKDINGATAGTLGLISSLVGSTVRVVVSATNGGGSTQAASAPTGLIGALLPGNTSLPSVAGSLIDGQTISAATGSWTGTGPINYSYQWEQCNGAGKECKELSGATASTLGLISSLVGSTVRVVVTATNGGGTTKATSAATSVVGALLPGNSSLPSIAGSLIDGQTLGAAAGSWTGTGPINYAYQWQQCNSAGETCKDIGGATAGTLSLVSGLVGNTVRVVVTATNAGGTTQATSPATGLIGALIPGNTSLPSIAGSLIDGQTLSAAAGSWKGTAPIGYAYQWQQCNGAGESCKDINGATSGALALVSSLVGSTVRVVVTATNAGGSTQVASAPTSAIGALLPGNTGLPSIAGSLIDGQTLSAATGSWSGTGPINYSYQWQQCNNKGEACKEVSGATGSTLGLISSLVGSTMRVVVTATNAGGTTQATSPATGLVGALIPGNTALPSVAGSLIDGQTLTAALGSWTGTGPINYSYQWEQCNAAGKECKELIGATAGTLGLISSLVGSTVRVVVTATNAGGSTQASSTPTNIIAALLPGNTSLPSVAGSLIDGQTLSAATGAWSGTAPINYGYQWQQCNSKGEACKELAGATGSTLGLISSLVGSTVRVVVTATNSGGTTQATSAPTGLIAALLPGNTALPSITGSLIDGQTLTAATGSWSGTSPINYSYQWQQCNGAGKECKELSGATGTTLGLISSLVGSTVRVVVTATNSGGSTQATSAATGLIAALLPSNTSLPAISGVLKDGQTLTAASGSWSGTGPINYSYQWEQCNSKGEACKEVSGATGGTLGLISSLVGSTVRVVVTATNSGGSTKASSAATGLIAALLPANTTLPSISGVAEDTKSLTGATGSWSGSTPIAYAYQWQQCNAKGEECKNISAEGTKETLGLVSSVVKSTVRLVVTASNSGGSTQATSAPTSPVLAALALNTVQPVIAGILEVGKKLLAKPETWTGTAPITYTYQWQLCGVLGLVGECSNIAGATEQEFLLGLLDAGLTLRVGVTAHNERGASQTAYSKVTGLVAGLKLSPVKGAAGTNVVLKGAEASTATTVNFGSAEVKPEVKSSTEVVAAAPAGSGTVPITVSTSEGTTHETPNDQFTYTP